MLTAIMRVGWLGNAILVGWPIVLFVLIQADGFYPVLRFDSPAANQIAGAASFLLPFVSLGFAASAPRHRFTRIVLIMVMSLPLCVCVVGVFGEGGAAIETLRTGVNPYFQLAARTPMDGYWVALYYDSLTFGSNIYVLQERPLVPGLLLIRPVEVIRDGREAKCQRIGQNRIKVDVAVCFECVAPKTHTPARTEIYDLNPNLYF
ncbi:MAG TPA: hypothetical protein VMT61_18960 [Candidatus Binataceae bacterium]|nr:hypothetical protein [Candidatus Binataceae bacterium]